MRKYEKYKPSGIEWLGKIPEYWEVKRVKDCSQINKFALSDKTAYDYQFKYVDIGNVNQNGIIQEPGLITFEEAPSRARRIVKENDVIISTVRTYLKAIAFFDFIPKDYIVSTGFAVLTHKSKVNPKFLAYHSQSECFIDSVIRNSTGVSYPAINSQAIAALHVIFPDFSEQTAIANYLDTKTAAIDRKIELLTAKADKYKALRRSLINETVCRGLPASEGFTPSETLTKMKDSGIEWIGKIPEHWEVKRVKDIFTYTTGNTPDSKNESYYEGNNTWICIGDISEDKYISDSKMKISDKAINDLNMIKTPKGSLLYSFKLSIGKMAFVEQDVYTNEAILSIFPNKRISLHFIYYMLPYFLELAATENIYGAKMLNQKIIANALLVVPKLEEQIQIASYLDSKTTQIDTILTNISNQISKLTQLRKTLINDVVTGKIKVTD